MTTRTGLALSDADRRDICSRFVRDAGGTSADVDAVIAYNRRVAPLSGIRHSRLPLPDEPFVEVWREYERNARTRGAMDELADRLIQLQFAVARGISETAEYRAAVRRGVRPKNARRVSVQEGHAVRLVVHTTCAGSLPVIVVPHRPDFERLLQALVYKNEPVPVAASMGAMLIAGYANWDRIERYRRAWLSSSAGATDRTWRSEFSRLIKDRSKYRDSFVLCSDGPYSGVKAAKVGMPDGDWIDASRVIRTAHEGAHYVTRRLYGSMEMNAIDELIADYVGIRAAAGVFRADWFQLFMGIESDTLNKAGRLSVYRGDSLTDTAFRAVQSMLREASKTLEAFDRSVQQNGAGFSEGRRLDALSASTLDELASTNGYALLCERCKVQS